MIKVYGIRPNQTVLEKCEVVMVIKTIVYHFLYIIFNKATQTHATDLGNGLENFTPCLYGNCAEECVS